MANLYFHGLSGYLVANSNEALKWAEISSERCGPSDLMDYDYGEYVHTAYLIIAKIYLEKGKKNKTFVRTIIMTLDQHSEIIDENNIYENWDENEEVQKELEGYQAAYFEVASVFYEAFTGLASTLDFGEEKINCLRNSLQFNGLCESYLKNFWKSALMNLEEKKIIKQGSC